MSKEGNVHEQLTEYQAIHNDEKVTALIYFLLYCLLSG